jgi:hypothetical protein
VSGTVVELFDVGVDDAEDDAVLPELGDAGVAAQVLDDEPLAAAVAPVAELVAVLPGAVAVGAAEPVAWMAIAPPRPTNEATLAVAATLRARRAGWGRLRRGVSSGITRSFGVEAGAANLETMLGTGGKRS